MFKTLLTYYISGGEADGVIFVPKPKLYAKCCDN